MPSNVAETTGLKFTKVLVDTLWYIDGHHEVLLKQSCPIPSSLTNFSDYNLPEMSKHRKRSYPNLDEGTISRLSTSLYDCLLLPLWNRNGWDAFKTDIEQLASSLYNYSQYLNHQNKRVKRHHMSPSPVRDISNSLCLKHISPIAGEKVLPHLHSLVFALKKLALYEFVLVEDFCNSEKRLKYYFLQDLSNGLPFPFILLRHTSGNNTGNMHFIWRCDETVTVAFEKSLATVERAKEAIPKFHTRAMKNTLFKTFGRICPTIKPHALR